MKRKPSAYPRDAHGERIYVNDMVRRYRHGSDRPIHWRRRATMPATRVEAIGDPRSEYLRGCIRIGLIWENPRNFEKVYQ